MLLESYQSKSTVVNTKINNVDVFGVLVSEQMAYVNYLRVANGMVIQSQNMVVKKKMTESDDEILLNAIAQMKNLHKLESEEFIVPFIPDIDSKIPFTVPVKWR
ncbi:MAG: hypothetical protein R2852_05065 [Bacteroidia bacterium]